MPCTGPIGIGGMATCCMPGGHCPGTVELISMGPAPVATIGGIACPGMCPTIIGPGIIGGGGVPGVGGPAPAIHVIGGPALGAPGPDINVIGGGGVSNRPDISSSAVGSRSTDDPGIGALGAALGETGARGPSG